MLKALILLSLILLSLILLSLILLSLILLSLILLSPDPVVLDTEPEDVISETFPPLFSFGDKALFKEKLEEKGIEGVTRDVVSFVKQQLPHFNFTYEELRDGSADVLNFLRPQDDDLPVFTASRAMTDEAILALFTDLEDYGKYDPPVQKRNADGSLAVDEEGQPLYEEKSYNLSAIAGGGRNTGLEAGALLVGGWAGARAGAALYASRAPQVGDPRFRALNVGAKGGAMLIGGIVGSGILQPVAEYLNEWLFEEPDPIVVPSLQAAYNAGETAAYGLTFLGSPWVGTKLAGRTLSSHFNAAKTLENFSTIASSTFKPDTLVKIFGKDLTDRALAAASVQASKSPLRKLVTPDVSKGPTATRIAETIVRGGAEVMEQGLKNPGKFLGTEALLAGGMSVAAYNAEKLFPGSAGARFTMEVLSQPTSLLLVRPVLGAYNVTKNLLKGLLSGKAKEKGQGFLEGAVTEEGGRRILQEIRESPEYIASDNPEDEIDSLIRILVEGDSTSGGAPLPSTVLDVQGSTLAPTLARTEAQVGARVSDLDAASEEGRKEVVANAKEAVLDLRKTKTPEAIQLAAAVEQRIVEQESIDVLETANTNLINSTQRLFGNDEVIPQDASLGERFYDLQLRMVSGLKTKRDKLWKAVPDFDVIRFNTADGTEVRQPNSLTIFEVPASEGGLKFSSEGAKREFNTILGGYKDDFKAMDDYYNPALDDAGNPPSSPAQFPVQFSRLREMVSHFKSLKAARLRVNPMDSMATHVDSLIKALNQDMTGLNANGIFGSPPGAVLNDVQANIVEAYTKANAYTYGMHNVISRTFVSEVSKVNAQRGMVLDPLRAVDAVKVGDDIPLARINEMQRAVNFLRKEAGDISNISYQNKSTGQTYKNVDFDAQQTGSELNEVIELIVRDARKNIMDTKVDKTTGAIIRTVNPKKLEAYKNRPNSAALFSIFPVLARDLDSVESAQRLMTEATAQVAALRNTPAQKAFAWFLQRPEGPSNVIAQIVSGEGKIPTRKALQTMVDKIKSRGSYTDTETGAEYTSVQILDGLRAAISGYAVTKSGGAGSTFSPTTYYDTLFTDIKSVDASSADGGFRLIDFMLDNGIVDKTYKENLEKALGQMRQIEEGIANENLSGALFKRPSLANLGMLRVGGSMLAGASLNRFKALLAKIGLQNFGVGASITAGDEGSRAAKRFILGPEILVVNNMARILADPEMLGVAIREAKDAEELSKNLTFLQKLLGGEVTKLAPKIARDVSSDESFIRPGEIGDREADYSQQRLAFPPVPACPACPRAGCPACR